MQVEFPIFCDETSKNIKIVSNCICNLFELPIFELDRIFTNMEEVILQLKTEGEFTKEFYFTKICLNKKDNSILIDHKWRFSGLLFILFVFLLIQVCMFYLIKYFLLDDKYLTPLVLLAFVLFAFRTISQIDGSKIYLKKLKNSSGVFLDNGFKLDV